ncbi:MAG: metallophosphoesterase family protein, partial [Thermoplasmata archaeon]
MKLAIIADVHSNLHALEAITKAIEDSIPDKVVCAGDIVGYGAFPNECCDEVNELADHIVQGNHDLSALTGDTVWMNPYAAAASDWTSREMSTKTRSFLGSLKTGERFEVRDLKVSMFHGSPTSVEEYVYEEDSSEAMLSAAACDLL